MTAEEINFVQGTFAKVAPIADSAAAMFYAWLFELDPSLRALFKGDLSARGRKLMQMIGIAMNGLTRLDDIVPLTWRWPKRASRATTGTRTVRARTSRWAT